MTVALGIVIAGLLQVELFMSEGTSEPSYDSEETNLTWLTSPKIVQKEGSPAFSPVSSSTEICLGKHPKRKKHMARKKKLEAKNSIGCKWEKPEFGWTKLNTDGSKSKKNVGFGGLLRDRKGHPICAFVSKAGEACGDDIFMVELRAVGRGLVLAAGLGIKALWVESDSMSVVKTINREQRFSPEASSCLNHIWELLGKFEKYKVSHLWRETNRVADHLAKMDLSESDIVLRLNDFPNGLCNIINDDAKGKIYRRRINRLVARLSMKDLRYCSIPLT